MSHSVDSAKQPASVDRPAVETLDRALFDRLLAQAREAPRRRTNHNFHVSMEDNPHRFLNVMLHGTYITPHRHSRPAKSESFLLLEGRLAFIIFDDDGGIARTQVLQAGDGRIPVGIDILPGVWHTLVVLSEHCICFEVKPGPYRVTDDKEFAEWAPPERLEFLGRNDVSDAEGAELEARKAAFLQELEARALADAGLAEG